MTSERNLTKNELNILRKNPYLRSLDEALSLCNDEFERKIITEIYPAAQKHASFISHDSYNHLHVEK